MKRALILMILLSIALAGCLGLATGDPTLTGTIVEKNGNKLLVVGGLLPEDKDKPASEIVNSGKYREVVWVTEHSLRSFKTGQKVEVWYTNSDDSYPGQTTAKKIRKA
jgi:hypothetical protein